MKQVIVIDTSRDAYSIAQVLRTGRSIMTAADLREYLDQYEDDAPVILSFDDGYTYGGITYCDIHDEQVDEDED